MHALTHVDPATKGGHKASPAKPRVVEKPSISGGLNSNNGDAPQQEAKYRRPIQVELLCHAETKRHDPLWDGPRLNPMFVTQLLGQVMDTERHGVIRVAYGNPAEKSAGLFDESL